MQNKIWKSPLSDLILLLFLQEIGKDATVFLVLILAIIPLKDL